MALEAELALTLKVLGTVADSTLGDVLDQPLHTLRHIHAELQACVSALGPPPCVWAPTPPVRSVPGPPHTAPLCPQVPAQSTAAPRPRGALRSWLHRLQEAQKKVSEQGVTSVGTTGSPVDGQSLTCRFLCQESHGCLEASVTFNLFRLLTRDLQCVASGDLCV